MNLLELDTYIKNSKAVGIAALIICIIAWIMEFINLVYVCPYCRVQRTIIGLLGLILILPIASHWIAKYIAIVIGFFGAVVASNQHFTFGWKKVSAGEFEFRENIFIDSFILSSIALTMIIGLLYIIIIKDSKND
jgi:hypothetical protein